MPVLIKRLALRVGFRGGFLLFLAISYLCHGIFLLAAKHAAVPVGGELLWGVTFTVVGSFMLTGVLAMWDRLQYTAAVFTVMLWSLEYFERAQQTPFQWATALMWLFIAIAVMLVSIWPEPYWLVLRPRKMGKRKVTNESEPTS